MKPIYAVLLIAGCTFGNSRVLAAEAGAPRVFLIDGAELARTRQLIRDGEKTLAPALAELVKRAEAAMASGPFSVINKNVVPPSGDKHDYMSLAPYWWPNPDTDDGLPYVRRDGERNPEIYDVRNRLDLGEMAAAVEGLALAYYFTGEEKYAQRAALLVLASIVDAASRHGLWPELLQLLPLLPAPARRRVAALGTGFGRPVLGQIVVAAHRQGLWGPLLGFATELEPRTQVLIAKLLASVDDDVLDALLDAVWEQRLEPELAHLGSLLPKAELQTFCTRLMTRGGEEFVAGLGEAARDNGLDGVSAALVGA